MNKNFSLLVTAISSCCFVVSYFLLGELQKVWDAAEFPLFDFQGQWALCAYTLRGVDPYAITGLKTPLIEEIGIIHPEWSTAPWGLLLGNFFYPGFLDTTNAGIYFLMLNIFFLLITPVVLKKNFFRLAPIITPALFISFFISSYFGNAGAVICCLLILSCVLVDDLPILSGIFLSVAMVKPQVALPICFALLLRKNFKVLTIAALTDFASWGAAAFITNQSPITLLTEFLSINTGGHTVFSGLFTLAFPEDKSLAMGLSMLAGVIFIWLTWRLGFKDEKIFWMCPACLATTFFAYSFHNEFFILILPALACIHFASREEIFSTKIFWLVAFVFLALGVYVLFLPLRIFLADLTLSFWIARTIFAVMLILLGFFMSRAFKFSA